MLDYWEQQSYNRKEERHPGQRIDECNSTCFKPTWSVFSVGDEQGDIVAVFKRMAFIPVIGTGAVYFLVDFFKVKRRKAVC